MTVGQLLASTSSSELAEWMAFDQIEPFGDPRADLRSAIVAAAVVNHSFSPPKQGVAPAAFMPFAPRRPEPEPLLLETAEDQTALITRSLFGKKT